MHDLTTKENDTAFATSQSQSDMNALIGNVERLVTGMIASRGFLDGESEISLRNAIPINDHIHVKMDRKQWKPAAFRNMTTGRLLGLVKQIMTLKKGTDPASAPSEDLISEYYIIMADLINVHAFLFHAYSETEDLDILVEKGTLENCVLDYAAVPNTTSGIRTAITHLDGVYDDLMESVSSLAQKHIETLNGGSDGVKEHKAGQYTTEASDFNGSIRRVLRVRKFDAGAIRENVRAFLAGMQTDLENHLDRAFMLFSKTDENISDDNHDGRIRDLAFAMREVIQKQNVRRIEMPRVFLKMHFLLGSFSVGTSLDRKVHTEVIQPNTSIKQRIMTSVTSKKEFRDSQSLLDVTDSRTLAELEREIEENTQKMASQSTEMDQYIDSESAKSFGLGSDSSLNVDNSVGNKKVAKNSVEFSTGLSIDYDSSNSTAEGTNETVMNSIDKVDKLMDKIVQKNVNETNSKKQQVINTSTDESTVETRQTSQETETRNSSKCGYIFVYYSTRQEVATVLFLTDISVRFSNVAEHSEFSLSELEGLSRYLHNDGVRCVMNQVRRACRTVDFMGNFHDMYRQTPVPHFRRSYACDLIPVRRTTEDDDGSITRQIISSTETDGEMSMIDADSQDYAILRCSDIRGLPIRKRTYFETEPGLTPKVYTTSDVSDNAQFINYISQLYNLLMRVMTQRELFSHIENSDDAFKLLKNAADLIGKNVLLNTLPLSNGQGADADDLRKLIQQLKGLSL